MEEHKEQTVPDLAEVFRDGLENNISINRLISIAIRSAQKATNEDIKPEELNFIVDLTLAQLTTLLEIEMVHCGRPVLTRIIHDLEGLRTGIKVSCISCEVEKMYWER